eukprot:TRINITY_DN1275_c0_g2_i5.p1 TRINITY_DN1275_c0_g2~~TRINITY_DN1275_c0_g2_i5.p1  ORF type:complete len:355 (-),score=57.59 TRINITY_DN1275_c0_g2_i5:750-1814(-)
MADPLVVDSYVQDIRMTVAQRMRAMLNEHMRKKETVDDDLCICATWESELFEMIQQQLKLTSEISCGPLLLAVTNTICSLLDMFCVQWALTICRNDKIDIAYMGALASSAFLCADRTKKLVTMVEGLLWDECKPNLAMNNAVASFLELSHQASGSILQLMLSDLNATFRHFFATSWLEKRPMAVVIATLRDYFQRFQHSLHHRVFNAWVSSSLDKVIAAFVARLVAPKTPGFTMTDHYLQRLELDRTKLEELFDEFGARPGICRRKITVMESILEFFRCHRGMVCAYFMEFARSLQPAALALGTMEVASTMLAMRQDMFRDKRRIAALVSISGFMLLEENDIATRRILTFNSGK